MAEEAQFDQLAAFKRYSAAPALVFSASLLGSFLGPMLLHLEPLQAQTWAAVAWGSLILFAAEFTARFALAHRRAEFLRGNLVDHAIMLLAFFGLVLDNSPLGIAFRIACMFLLVFEVGKDVRHLFRARNFPYAVAVVVLALIVCGSLEYHFEADAKGANVTSPADGLWWAMTTLSTVGYGDKYPVTPAGRIIASVLMVIGIAFTGVLSAVFTSIVLKKDEAQLLAEGKEFEERVERAVRAQLEPLIARIDQFSRGKDGTT